MSRAALMLAAALALSFLAGCSENEEEAAEVATPRPVVTLLADRRAEARFGYTGTVEPRFETTLAFRTLGRLVSRDVDVGDRVERGQVLAAIDAETLASDLRSAKAQLANARIQARTAEASAVRTRTLFADRTVSQSDLDVAEQSRSVAAAELRSAEANLAKAENALTFAVLTAPFDGVVTAREADVGQVVQAGASVMTLARTDQREAVVDVAAGESSRLAVGDTFRVVLQIEPSLAVSGSVREIAPRADALTRTNRVRIRLDAPPAAFRIGALVTATPVGASGEPPIFLPKSAVFEEDGKAMVWIVAAADGTRVEKRAVAVEEGPNGLVSVTSGVSAGERVVIAGVKSLEEGQTVTLQDAGQNESGIGSAS